MAGEVLSRVQDMLVEKQIGALVVSSPESVTYSAGYEVPSQAFPIRERIVFCVITASGDQVMLVPDMETSLAQKRSLLKSVRDYNEFTDDPVAVIADVLRELVVTQERIALEDDYLPYPVLSRLVGFLPDATILPAKPLMDDLRLIKTAGEIHTLSRLAQIAERAIYYASERAHEGVSELEMAYHFYKSVLSEGAGSMKELIIGSGDRAEYANANPTARRLCRGDLVRMDVLAKDDGYLSDVARTAVVGDPTRTQRDTWAKLVEARSLLLDRIKPGVSTQSIFRFYQEYFEKVGLKPISFVGHGLGLSVHEGPYISRHHTGELRPGMVIALEPLYLASGEGYHVEDTIVVTEHGHELVTGLRDLSDLITIAGEAP